MESHAHAFQQMLKQERQNLDKSLNHQKADMLQRLVMFCGCAFRIQARIPSLFGREGSKERVVKEDVKTPLKQDRY